MPYDAFLKLGSIKGESQVKGFEDQIQIQSFQWGAGNAGSGTVGGGGSGAGVPTRSDFVFTADSSLASPELFIASVTGEHLKEGLLTLRSAAGGSSSSFSTIKLTDVSIAAYGQAGSDDGAAPIDEFALRYAKVEFSYGGVTAAFDFIKNTQS